MGNFLEAGDLGIHFVNDISTDEHYIYDVELENVGSSGVNYDMKFLYCNNGENVLDLDNFIIPDGKVLLNEGHLIVGSDRVSGIVAFEKDLQVPNDSPVFEYDVVNIVTYSAQIGGV